MSVDKKTAFRCCGCMGCADVCPVKAISKGIDKDGFIVPVVDAEKCIDCGKCDDACAFYHDDAAAHKVIAAYAFQLNATDELAESTSGGAFTALSDLILAEEGVIVGSVMDDALTVKHTAARTGAERDRMRLSKYVQSDTTDVFSRVKELLDGGTDVLFVGTPCQAGQLRRLIGDHPRLLICDFICHGVPSQTLFSAHIDYLESRYQKKAIRYTFRSKRYGWNHGIDEITFSDGSRRDSMDVQCFSRLFQGNISLRDSCMTCPYAGERHCADVTIADFWGYEKISGHADLQGVSLILTNTAKGDAAVSEMKAFGKLTEVSLEKLSHRLTSAELRSIADVDAFRRTLREDGYESAVRNVLSDSLKRRVRFFVKKKVLKARYKNSL